MPAREKTRRNQPASDGRRPVGDKGARNLSKVTPPTPHRVHPSARLFGRLDDLRAPITWIHGPPGSGKTTLAASYLAAKEIEPLWYRLDEGDADPATLFHYLGEAWQGRKAGLHLPRLSAEVTFPLFSRRFFRTFFACPRTHVVVLDDYHEIEANSVAHACLANGLEEVPHDRRVIIISRTPPPPPLARLRVNGLIEVIEPDALLMTLDEAEGLVNQRGIDLPTARVATMLSRAQGWTTGLILIAEAGEESAVGPAAVPDVMFDYFAGEILQRMSFGRQRLLCILAVMPTMTAVSAERLTGSTEADALLKDLRRRNYFTTRDGAADPTYRFHPLFRDFLLAGARELLSPDELTAVRIRAAEVRQEGGNPEAAVNLLEEAGAFEALAGLIKHHAKILLDEGRNATLVGWLIKLPQSFFKDDAWLNYWAGSAHVYNAPTAAISYQRTASRLFEARGDVVGLYLAWAAETDAVRGDAYGDFARSDALVDRLDALLIKYPKMPNGAVTLKVAICMSMALSRRSNDRDAISLWRDRAFCASREVPGEHWARILGHIFAVSALHDAAYGAASHFLQAPLKHRALGTEWVEMSYYIAPAMMLLYRQTAGDCAVFVESALRTMEGVGYLAWANTISGMAAADIFRRGGDPAAARAWLTRIGKNDVRFGTRHSCIYYTVAAQVEVMSGNLALARQHADAAIQLGVKQGWHFYTGAARLTRIGVLIEIGDLSCAAAEHAELGRLMASSATRIFGVSALLYEAAIAFSSGDEATGGASLVSAFALARQQGDRSVYCSAALSGRLCARALALGVEPDTVRAFIRASGIPAPDLHDETWPRPLAIRTLGSFTVIKDGLPLAFSRKTPKRLIMLLKAIIAFGGREVPEEKLIDAVWPDEDGDAATNAMRIALHRLRKLLGDPECIVVKAGRIGLDPSRCWIDLWSFEYYAVCRQSAETAANYRDRLTRAQALYRGAFLDGDDEYWWIEQRRARCCKMLGLT